MNQILTKTHFQGPLADLVVKLAAFVAAQNGKARAEIMGFVYLAASSQVSADLKVHEDGSYTLTMQGVDRS